MRQRGSFCVLKKLYMRQKQKICRLISKQETKKYRSIQFQYISIVLSLPCNKNELYNTLDCCSKDMINFDCLEKSLIIVSSPHFVYDFSRKCFSCYIVLTDQISLPDFLYFLKYWSVFVKTLVLELILVKTPVLEYLFDKAAGLRACTFNKKRLQLSIFL